MAVKASVSQIVFIVYISAAPNARVAWFMSGTPRCYQSTNNKKVGTPPCKEEGGRGKRKICISKNENLGVLVLYKNRKMIYTVKLTGVFKILSYSSVINYLATLVL